jgi:hypothetical protein
MVSGLSINRQEETSHSTGIPQVHNIRVLDPHAFVHPIEDIPWSVVELFTQPTSLHPQEEHGKGWNKHWRICKANTP